MRKKRIHEPTPEQMQLLSALGSKNKDVAIKAAAELAQALNAPFQSALIDGDIVGGIFTPEVIPPGATPEYPLDFYNASTEGDFAAYMIPSVGALPLRTISGDAVTVRTYATGNSIDWPIRYARTARWNIVARAMEILEAGFVAKMNTDGWRVVIAAAAGRTDYNGGAPMVYDSTATGGQFTKRLISLMKTQMARLGGGNTASPNRSMLTDLYISLEALEDIREWDSDEVDDVTRREIFTSADGSGPLAQLYGVNIHPLSELGVGQQLQTYFASLGISMATGDEEIVVGLDLSSADSFVMPVVDPVEVFVDETLHRRRLAGFYAWQEHGFACLDDRRCLLGCF